MFTFSFSGAFADTATPAQKTDLTTATAIATTQAQTNFELAMKELSNVTVANYAIADTTLAAQKDAIWAELSKAINDQTTAALEDYTYSGTGSTLAAAVYGGLITVEGIKTWIAKEPNAEGTTVYEKTGYGTKLAKAQYDLDAAKEEAKYDKIDMSKYSTYADRVKAYAEVLKKEAKDSEVTNENATATDYAFNMGQLRAKVNGNLDAVYVEGFEGQAGYETGLYILSAAAVNAEKSATGESKKIQTAKEEADAATTGAATAASIKAEAAKKAATYKTTVSSKDGVADAYTTIIGWLADEQEITDSIANWQAINAYTDAEKAGFKAALEDVDSLKAIAKKYAAETNGEGVAVRDSAEIDKIVKQATTDFYASAIGLTTLGYVPTYKSLGEAVTAIVNLNTNDAAYDLSFAKEAAKAYLNELKANAEDTYYPAELEKYNAEIDKVIAKVEAAKDAAKIDTKAEIDAMIPAAVSTIMPKTAVDALIVDSNGDVTSAAASNAITAVSNYVTYVNTGKTTIDSTRINYDAETVIKALQEIYGENGARTESARKATTIDAAAIAAKLSTIGGLDAAHDAAVAAIKALPATADITVADLEAVKAAFDADAAYMAMNGATAYAEQATLASDINALYTAMTRDFNIKVSQVDKDDKAALKALKAEIETANKEVAEDKLFEGKSKFSTTAVTKALEDIRTKELKAVQTAANLIPVNVTEADKATVENARKLYDAFVEEYTDYGKEVNDAYNAVAELTKTTLRAIEAAEATLGLNTEDPAMAVKAFKIKASSKATKGTMTISWRVIDGDKSAAKGYQVWRSTKANKGFKKMITTKKMTYKNTKNLKKGTTYYYRVRAYARTAEGKLVFSDFSNKAYRKAK